ncbi:MAG: hypothetical protein ACTSXY_15380 [Promethearchaeota archaeon]
MDLGGDSSRLYFLDPMAWNENIAYYLNNSLAPLDGFTPNSMIIPFNWFLTLISSLIGKGATLNNFINGLLLCGMYISVYLSIQELFKGLKIKITKNEIICASLAGLFYALSPILFYESFYKTLYSVYGYAIYPIMFFLFLRFANTEKFLYLAIILLISFVFSVNFSLFTVPWFAAFFLFIIPFVIIYHYLQNSFNKKILGYYGLFIFLAILIHIFSLIPEIYYLSTPKLGVVNILSEESSTNRGLAYFLSVSPYIKLIYNLTNQPQYLISSGFHPQAHLYWDYGIRFHFIYFIYPLIITVGILLVSQLRNSLEKKIYILLTIFFIIFLFLMTANIGGLFWLYESAFSIPGFQMFRSFYTKFAAVFVFIYALLFGMSLRLIFKHLNVSKIIIILCLSTMILFQSIPLLTGKFMNEVPLWLSKDVPLPNKFNEEYKNLLSSVKDVQFETSFMSFPLTNEQYSVIAGEYGGAYFGPTPLAFLAGKKDYNGLGSFLMFRTTLIRAINEKNYNLFNNLMAILNIRYFIVSTDNNFYNRFPSYPYSSEVKKSFPDTQSMQRFFSYGKYQKLVDNKRYDIFVSKHQEKILPPLYIADDIIVNNSVKKMLNSQRVLQDKTNIAFVHLKNADSTLSKKIKHSDAKNATIEFKRINPTKYRVIVHGVKSDVFLSFLESFLPQWKVFPISYDSLNGYYTDKPWNQKSILNKINKAGSEELERYHNKGLISARGNAFISKQYRRTIQNNNLDDGNIFTTFNVLPLDEKYHFPVNNYANGWLLDLDYLTKHYPESISKRASGLYDVNLIIEFEAQKTLYYSAIISGITVLILLIYVLWHIDFKLWIVKFRHF